MNDESRPSMLLKHGDCVAGMRQLEADCVDVTVTSPPYNIGIDYGTYVDAKTREEYLAWCDEWAEEIRRVLAPTGSFFLNLGNSSSNPFFAFSVAMRVGRLFTLQNTIVWVKSISIEREGVTESYGHFKPLNSKRYLNDCHEYLFHFTHGGTTMLDRLAVGVPYADKSNVRRWGHTAGRDRRCRGNNWFIPYKTIQRSATQRPHPATFPVELAARCIRLHGQRHCTVLDPFLGIGHAGLAAVECRDLVDRFIGFDIDAGYMDTASALLQCSYTPVTPKGTP